MADIGVRIVGEDQASSAFRSISEASRQTANDVGGLGGAFNSMSNTIASGVVKGQAVIGLFNGILSAAQGVTSAIGGFINTTQRMNSDLENTKGSFGVLLGSAEKATEMINQMRVASQTTTMSFEEFRNSGKYLLSFQFEASKVVDITKSIGAAVYALNAQDVGGMERIIRALGQMKAAGKITLENLNQLTEVGVPAIKMLSDVFGTSTSQMTEMIHKGLLPADQAIDGLINQFKRLYGASGDQMAQNLSVVTSNLGDFWQQAQQVVGSGVFTVYKQQLQEVTKVLGSPVFMQIATQLGGVVGDAYRKFNETAVAPAMRAVVNFMNALDTTNPRPAITRLLTDIEGLLNGLITQYLGGNGLSVVKNFMSVFNQLAQSGVTLLQSGNIFTALKQISSLGQDSDAGKFVGLLANEFGNLIQAGGQLKQFLIPVLKDVMDSLSAAAGNPSVKAFATAFTELFSVTNKEGQTFHLQLGEIIGFVRTAVANLVEFLTPIGPVIKKIFEFILPQLELALNLMTNIMQLANNIKKLFSDVQSASIAPANQAGQAIAGNFSQGLSASMATASQSIAATVIDKLTQTGNYLASSASVSSTWANVGNSIAQSITNGYNGGFAGLINAIQSKIGVAEIKIGTTPSTITGGFNANGNGAKPDSAQDQGIDPQKIYSSYSNSRNTEESNSDKSFAGPTRIYQNSVTIVTNKTDPRDLIASANFLFQKNAFNS
jgi:tape measure domain-containing protein